jgi:hypothetical protein
VLLLVVPLAVAGVEQGMKLAGRFDPLPIPISALEISCASARPASCFLLGSLLFAANIFVMTIQWKLALVKTVIAYIKSPLKPRR